MSNADISRAIEKELKQEFPDYKFKVTGIHSSVKVLLHEYDSELRNPDYDQQKAWEIGVGRLKSWEENDPREVYTEEGKAVSAALEKLVNQYNHTFLEGDGYNRSETAFNSLVSIGNQNLKY